MVFYPAGKTQHYFIGVAWVGDVSRGRVYRGRAEGKGRVLLYSEGKAICIFKAVVSCAAAGLGLCCCKGRVSSLLDHRKG